MAKSCRPLKSMAHAQKAPPSGGHRESLVESSRRPRPLGPRGAQKSLLRPGQRGHLSTTYYIILRATPRLVGAGATARSLFAFYVKAPCLYKVYVLRPGCKQRKPYLLFTFYFFKFFYASGCIALLWFFVGARFVWEVACCRFVSIVFVCGVCLCVCLSVCLVVFWFYFHCVRFNRIFLIK